MDQVTKLQTENEHLSNVAMNGNEGSVAGVRPQTYVTMINAGLNDIEQALFEDINACCLFRKTS